MSLDRRTTIKWMFAAAATVPSLQVLGAAPPLARLYLGGRDRRLGFQLRRPEMVVLGPQLGHST